MSTVMLTSHQSDFNLRTIQSIIKHCDWKKEIRDEEEEKKRKKREEKEENTLPLLLNKHDKNIYKQRESERERQRE